MGEFLDEECTTQTSVHRYKEYLKHLDDIYIVLTVDGYYSISGVSNLFDRRAKGTNFKLVGGQSEMPKASRRQKRRGEKGMGRWCPPPQPTRESGGA